MVQNYKEPCITNKKGCMYSIPNGMDDINFYTVLDELISFCESKGLTARQAQFLFEAGQDYILETKLNNFSSNNNDLHEISKSLRKIADKGIDTFARSTSTGNYF